MMDDTLKPYSDFEDEDWTALFIDPESWDAVRDDLVTGEIDAARAEAAEADPPYNRAAAILETAFSRARAGVALLLRLSFLEPTNGRGAWLQAHAAELSHLLIFGGPRPSFTADGRTDSATVAWMVWQRDWTGGHLGGTDVRFIAGWADAAPRPCRSYGLPAGQQPGQLVETAGDGLLQGGDA